MKRNIIISVVLLAVVLLLLFSCSRIGPLGVKGVTVTEINGSQSARSVELSEDEVELLKDIFSDCRWVVGGYKCIADYELKLSSGTVLEYSTEAGAFNYASNSRGASLSSEQMAMINEILLLHFGEIE